MTPRPAAPGWSRRWRAHAYERGLAERLLAGLATVEGLVLHGPTSATARVPTFAFTLDGHAPGDVAQALADRGIFAGAGHFYAVEAIATLGLAKTGGIVRVGLCHYNTAEEVDALIAALRHIARGR